MITNKKIAVVAVLSLGTVFGVLTNCREDNGAFSGKATIPNTVEKQERLESLNLTGAASSVTPPSPAAAAPASGQAKHSSEYRALLAMSHLMALAVKPDTTLEKLVTRLVEYGVEPEISHSTNSETGDQFNLRTKNPFKGTRNFKALYFGSAGITPFPQHLSFEFRPGPTAMKDAVSAIEQAFPNTGKAVEENETFRKYKLADDYILWVKKMSSQDLADDPDIVYDPADAGTIRIAIEPEIHEGESDNGEQGE